MSLAADVTVLGGLTLHAEVYAEDDYDGFRGYVVDALYWPPKGRKGKYRAISQAMYDRVLAYDEQVPQHHSIVHQVLDARHDGNFR